MAEIQNDLGIGAPAVNYEDKSSEDDYSDRGDEDFNDGDDINLGLAGIMAEIQNDPGIGARYIIAENFT